MSSQSPGPSTITLRPVGPDNNDFLIEVYGSTRAEELALAPWTDEQRGAFIHHQFTAQQDHYAQHYPAANHDIIVANGRQLGRLYVARLDKEIRIVDITLLRGSATPGLAAT